MDKHECQFECQLSEKIEDQNKMLKELKDGQLLIHNALLGSLNSNSIGLIEESRTLRRDVNNISHALMEQDTKIKSNTEEIATFSIFRSDVKRVVAFIAITIPFAFEIFKITVTALWDAFSKKGGV